MANKVYKPTTPGRRNYSVASFEEITVNEPEKTLTKKFKSRSGRNHSGRITVRRRGGGHKKLYRFIDFKRSDKIGMEAKVKTVEYDPNRTCYICLVYYTDGEKRYVLAPEGIQVGDTIICNEKCEVKIGNRMQLKNIPVSYNIYNIELSLGRGGQIVRTAGSSAKITSLDGKYAQVALPSGEVRFVSKDAYATIGRLSNVDHSLIKIGKAGRQRWMGNRPKVLGKSMNPCDHPHGGGEGHSPIGLKHPKTPTGMPALGYKTRTKRKYTNKFIAVSRHRNKK